MLQVANYFSDIPDAPQNLEVHDISSRNVRLTWNKPFDGNSPILQYTVMWRQINGELFLKYIRTEIYIMYVVNERINYNFKL